MYNLVLQRVVSSVPDRRSSLGDRLSSVSLVRPTPGPPSVDQSKTSPHPVDGNLPWAQPAFSNHSWHQPAASNQPQPAANDQTWPQPAYMSDHSWPPASSCQPGSTPFVGGQGWPALPPALQSPCPQTRQRDSILTTRAAAEVRLGLRIRLCIYGRTGTSGFG